MALALSSQLIHIIGIVFSAIGITLGLFQAFVRKVHSRALDYLQWAYLITVFASVTFPFSKELNVSSGDIVLNDQISEGFYCAMNTYVCVTAFAVSFMVILVGTLVLLRLITIPERVREKGFTFPRVYRFLKGLLRWFWLPLIFMAIFSLFSQSTTNIASVVVLAVLGVFPFVQLILYKCYDQQGEDPFIKWLQFASYLKGGLFALLGVLSYKYNGTVYYYYIAFILVVYAGFFVFKNNFRYQTAGKVFYIFGEVIFYFLFSLYAAGSALLTDYYIDLFGLGLILLLDIIYFIMETVSAYREWKSSAGQVIPEDTKDGPPTKKNRYEVEELDGELNKNNSRDTLNDSNALGNSSINKNKNTKARPK